MGTLNALNVCPKVVPWQIWSLAPVNGVGERIWYTVQQLLSPTPLTKTPLGSSGLILGTWYREPFCHQMGPYQTLRAGNGMTSGEIPRLFWIQHIRKSPKWGFKIPGTCYPGEEKRPLPGSLQTLVRSGEVPPDGQSIKIQSRFWSTNYFSQSQEKVLTNRANWSYDLINPSGHLYFDFWYFFEFFWKVMFFAYVGPILALFSDSGLVMVDLTFWDDFFKQNRSWDDFGTISGIWGTAPTKIRKGPGCQFWQSFSFLVSFYG